MNPKITALILVLLMVSVGHSQRRVNYGETPWGRIDYVLFDLSPEKCSRVTKFEGSQFRACPTVGGYRLLYSGNESSPQIIIVAPNRMPHVIQYWAFKSGDFVTLENPVSWQVARSRSGKITPMILILRANLTPDEFTRYSRSSTIVVKLTPAAVCVVGRVPTGAHAAMDLATVTNSARMRKCVGPDDIGEKDWVGLTLGLAAKGQYDEALSVIKKIESPGDRTVAYIGIARRQAEGGDQVAARATLLMGFDDLLNQKEPVVLVNAYGAKRSETSRELDLVQIIATMAVVGLYDDVNNKLEFVAESDLPGALLMIGKIQGGPRSVSAVLGKRDLQAANATFKRAIQLELARADRTSADRNLQSIALAQ